MTVNFDVLVWLERYANKMCISIILNREQLLVSQCELSKFELKPQFIFHYYQV